MDAPSAMCSAASFQYPIPPIPTIGIFTALATEETRCSAIGFTAGPQYPPCDERPPTFGVGANVSRLTLITELIVLIKLTASAPARSAARATLVMSVTFGVSFTITGV